MSRRLNEDYYSIDDEDRLYAVADGMGGHRNGEIASRLAVRSMTEALRASRRRGRRRTGSKRVAELTGAISRANQRVREEVDRNPALEGMGTTIVALLATEWLLRQRRFPRVTDANGGPR